MSFQIEQQDTHFSKYSNAQSTRFAHILRPESIIHRIIVMPT